MERRVYDVIKEPTGNTYRKLIDLALENCKTALLVVQRQNPLAQTAINTMNLLAPYLKLQREEAEWPGTKLFAGKTALVTYYHFEQGCADILKMATNSLYSWNQPELPEDLCFIRSDGEPWLVSIAHELDAYFYITAEERQLIEVQSPEISSTIKTKHHRSSYKNYFSRRWDGE